VFGTDGDIAPLAEIVGSASRHRLRLIIDESHAIGTVGPGGRGALARTGLEDHVDVILGTLATALGSYGAFAACDRTMAKYLMNAARTFGDSTALPPPATAGALAALDMIEQRPRLVDRLRANAAILRDELARQGFAGQGSVTQIVPLAVGDARLTVRIGDEALARGVLVQAVHPAASASAQSRLRLAVMASHREPELRAAARTLAAAARASGYEPGHLAVPARNALEPEEESVPMRPSAPAPAPAPAVRERRREPASAPSAGVFDFEAAAA